MGLTTSISNLFTKPKNVLVVGLDAAGKTTMLFKLKSENVQDIPTVGYAVETIKWQNFQFTAFDLGGGQKLKPLWRHFYESSHGVVFVFDSQDRDKEKWKLAAEELHGLSAELANEKPILIFANKQDLGDAMKVEEISEILRTRDLKQKDWHIQPCSATKGDGLHEGLEWMSNCFKKK